MSTNEDDGSGPTRARQPLAELRRTLGEVRASGDVERIHAALIDVVDGLVSHAERQVRAVEELRSDLGHKQGIVTRIDGGPFSGQVPAAARREFAAGPDGDRWSLGRDEASGIAYVLHESGPPAGAAATRVELGAFLGQGTPGPEAIGLLKLIGSLIA